MPKLRHFAIPVIATLLLVVTTLAPLPALALNPYLAGYFTGTAISTEHVICDVLPYDIPYSCVPSGNFLGGVMSVAGYKDGSLSGWVYQIATLIKGGVGTRWNTQSWNPSGPVDVMERTITTAQETWYGIFVRMDMEANYVKSRCWGYRTSSDWSNDTPTFTSSYDLDKNTGEDYFRVGTSVKDSITFKHDQFGMESYSRITGCNWVYPMRQIGYYDNGWRYRPAKVTHYGSNYITWYGSSYYLVG